MPGGTRATAAQDPPDHRGRAVALVPGGPAGVIFPRTAGIVAFRATLSWETPERAPVGDLPGLPFPGENGAATVCIAQEPDAPAGARSLAGEVRALGRPELGRALERVLRAVASAAALTEAVLELETVRCVAPGVASPRALEALARDLWAGGFRVRFAPSWTPVPGAEVAVGGADRELEAFLLSHPRWEVVCGGDTEGAPRSIRGVA